MKPSSLSMDDLYVPVTESGCWLWLGACSGRYGSYKHQYAHRLFYEREHGPVPEGCEIDHLCAVPCCVNPSHLEAVSHAVNILRGRRCSTWKSCDTKCKHGHDLSNPSAYYRSAISDKVFCKECQRGSVRRYRQRKVEALCLTK